MDKHLYLAHHGIKGQRWGVRRFQNKDGTLTEAGKRHYSQTANIGDDDMSFGKKSIGIDKAITDNSKAAKSGISGAQKVVSGTQKIASISNEQPRNRYNKRKPLTQEEMDKMSNKELQELVTRMNLEQQYSMLTQDQVSRGRVEKGLRYADAILSIAGGVLTVAVAYKTLKG